jgi:hypothetical protein
MTLEYFDSEINIAPFLLETRMNLLISLTAIVCLWPLALLNAVKVCDIDNEVETETLCLQANRGI